MLSNFRPGRTPSPYPHGSLSTCFHNLQQSPWGFYLLFLSSQLQCDLFEGRAILWRAFIFTTIRTVLCIIVYMSIDYSKNLMTPILNIFPFQMYTWLDKKCKYLLLLSPVKSHCTKRLTWKTSWVRTKWGLWEKKIKLMTSVREAMVSAICSLLTTYGASSLYFKHSLTTSDQPRATALIKSILTFGYCFLMCTKWATKCNKYNQFMK